MYKTGPVILQQAILGTLEDSSDCWTVTDTCWLGGKNYGTGEPVCVCGGGCFSPFVCVCVLAMWDKVQWMSFYALESIPLI